MNLGPRTRFFIAATGVFLLLGLLMRIAFHAMFARGAPAVAYPFYVGFKFDLRLALLLTIPFFLLVRIRVLDPARTPRATGFWSAHYALVATAVLGIYATDLGHYDYLEERLNASALRFLKNPLISAQMVWESYPVVTGAFAIAVAAALFYFAFRFLLRRAYRHEAIARPLRQAVPRIAVGVVICLALLYGKFSYYPLRWSDAFQSPQRYSSDLGLNPVLFFVDTLYTDEDAKFDEDATRACYPRMADYLGVEKPDPGALTYARTVRPTPLGNKGPNVVVILLESFAAHHCGAFGNPLDPSPHFDRLAKRGILFTNFYTPRMGTARAVFASLTGVPDLVRNRVATRNPRIIGQQTILGAIEGYEKHYFLGGSVNWANIRGVLRNNIPDLHLHEEGSYTAPRVDVWGISDLHLFEEANRIFREPRDKPFLAFVHCSGNHRPYTIPDDDRGFRRREVDAGALSRHGFIDVDEFNSFRFLDHSIGWFIEAARKEKYFENTIFLMYGDNGTPGRTEHMQASESELGIGAHHTPLLVYPPGRLSEGRKSDTPCGQTDVMATVAGLTGYATLNTTLGRNLLDPQLDNGRSTFLLRKEGLDVRLGLLDRTHYLSLGVDGSEAKLQDRASTDPHTDVSAHHPEKFQAMRELCLAYYETARWMLYRNKPERYRR
ncbi:MAG: LTA synthase family protein [Planctomycetota bacterium]|jgi:phosphoglycerol transferase MdoB-like AlkP superfamily enzyme